MSATRGWIARNRCSVTSTRASIEASARFFARVARWDSSSSRLVRASKVSSKLLTSAADRSTTPVLLLCANTSAASSKRRRAVAK